jgi:hypothetical protein
VKPLKKMRRFFAFPTQAIKENDKKYIRKRGGKGGLEVCRSPHIIVSESRNFAVFTNDYLVVPSGQIGICSPRDNLRFLKALTLYLNSDFAFYHQFLISSRLGVKRPVATIDSLRQLPVPIKDVPKEALKQWTDLHDRLVEASKQAFARKEGGDLFAETGTLAPKGEIAPLIDELNALVYDTLGIKPRERALIEDLVRVRLELDDGKIGKRAVGAPEEDHLRRYAKRLKSDLDSFLEDRLPKRHRVEVIFDSRSGMVEIDLVPESERHGVAVCRADADTAQELEKTRQRLRTKRAQWVYFDRNLRVFEGRRTFIFKPMQRFHWTESQAMTDAAEIIAQTLEGNGVKR